MHFFNTERDLKEIRILIDYKYCIPFEQYKTVCLRNKCPYIYIYCTIYPIFASNFRQIMMMISVNLLKL